MSIPRFQNIPRPNGIQLAWQQFINDEKQETSLVSSFVENLTLAQITDVEESYNPNNKIYSDGYGATYGYHDANSIVINIYYQLKDYLIKPWGDNTSIKLTPYDNQLNFEKDKLSATLIIHNLKIELETVAMDKTDVRFFINNKNLKTVTITRSDDHETPFHVGPAGILLNDFMIIFETSINKDFVNSPEDNIHYDPNMYCTYRILESAYILNVMDNKTFETEGGLEKILIATNGIVEKRLIPLALSAGPYNTFCTYFFANKKQLVNTTDMSKYSEMILQYEIESQVFGISTPVVHLDLQGDCLYNLAYTDYLTHKDYPNLLINFDPYLLTARFPKEVL